MKLVLDRIMREISQKSVLDFIVAGNLLLFLLESVLLHDGAQLIPRLVGDVHLLFGVSLLVEEVHDWRLPWRFLEVGYSCLVFLLEVFEDEFLHLRKTIQLSSGARL